MQNKPAIKLVTPQVAAESEIWNTMTLRIENSYGTPKIVDWVYSAKTVKSLSKLADNRGVIEMVAFMTGVEDFIN